MPLTATQLERALDLSRRYEDEAGARVRELLEDARKDIITTLASQPDKWKAQYLRDILERVDLRISRLAVDFGTLSVAVTERAIFAGSKIGILPKPATAPVTMLPLEPTYLKGLADYRADLIKGLTDDTRNKISAIIRRGLIAPRDMGDIMKELGTVAGRGVFKNLEYRGEVIFRTEYLRIANMSNQVSMEDSAKYVPNLKKRWVATFHNTRPAHVAAHGQVVPVDKPFIVGNEPMMYPLDPMGSPQNVVNCRCVAVPVVG